MKKKSFLLASSLLLMALLLSLKWSFNNYTLDIIIKVREAIHTHDNGPLILSSAMYSLIHAFVGSATFITVFTLTTMVHPPKRSNLWFQPFVILLFTATSYGLYAWYGLVFEFLPNFLACLVVMLLLIKGHSQGQLLIRSVFLSIQVFFAFQWLNLVPFASKFGFGQTDIPNSIRIVSSYLKNPLIMDLLGSAFFLGLMVSAALTVFLFFSFDRYLSVSEQNYENEKFFRSKILENRIYEEVHALTHDLKTPLVTIRGLSSLIPMCNDHDAIALYAERIDGAAEKMSDMISSFLYDDYRQMILLQDLIDTVKAQLPLQNPDIEFDVTLPDSSLLIYINKIRMTRAIINIIENAIMVKTQASTKTIHLNVSIQDDALFINILDNGMGIPKNHIHHIFEIGFSLKGTTGLGLAFAKKVIQDHDGDLILIKSDHFGSHFQIKLPFGQDQVERTSL